MNRYPPNLTDEELQRKILDLETAIPEIPLDGPSDDSQQYALAAKTRMEQRLAQLLAEQQQRRTPSA